MNMERFLKFVLAILFLHLNSVNAVTKVQLDKKCQAKDKQLFNLQENSSCTISFFTSPEHPITIQVSFEGREAFQDNDLLILYLNSGIIQRKREGYATSQNITLQKAIPIGWNSMNITMHDHKIEIGNFYTFEEFEYQLLDIQVCAKYFTSCANRTPSWEINNSSEVDIPLKGLSTAGLLLSSDQPFHPELTFNGIDIPLSYIKEMFIRKSNKLLPPQEYQIVLGRSYDMLSVYSITKNGECKLLLKANSKEDIQNMKVRAIEGAFAIALDPFHENPNGPCYDIQKDEKGLSENELENKEDIQTSNSNCKWTPSWEVSESEEIFIPLNGLSSATISLHSDQAFHPSFILNNLDIPLSYDEGLVVRNTNMTLPPQDYQLYIERNYTMIDVYTVSKKEEYELLIKVNTIEDLKNVRVMARIGEFVVRLDPLHRKLEDDIKKHSMDLNCQCDAQSSVIWHIATGVFFGVTVILLIIVMRHYRPRCISKQIQSYDMEEGAAGVPLLEKNPIKNTIKSIHTEPHGESNTQMGENHKDICQIKLRSDKKDDHKRILGELDQSKATKTILVVGETGSGKSSFNNAMVNYIYGVTYDDTFRFKLIDDMEKSNEYGMNNTDEIMAYYIPFMSGIKHECNYIFIDTPGYGDSRGIDEDRKWNQKFYDFLKQNPDIKEVHGICFVVKASDTRLTSIQEYIIAGLFSMFGKDISKNIYAVVSYSDGSDTHVPQLLEKSGLGCNLALHFNSDGLYNDIKVEKDAKNYFMKNWNMNITNMGGLFKALMKTTAVNLSLTTVVLEENKDINKIRDEILELMVSENYATDQEKQELCSRIEQRQELLMLKLDEAQKLSGRLENIPAKTNPLVINEYIDMLMKDEQNKDKILEMEKLKKRNTAFQTLIKDRKSPKSIANYILGEKIKKTE